MARAFVLGNGISRQGLDLNLLQKHGKIYGCNALYREFIPDVLVATDRPISAAIQESGYALKNLFYTRRPIDGLGAQKISGPYFGYSSGPNAVAIAAEHQHDTVYLLGFDMGPSAENKINNVYAGTEFYKPSNASPTYTGNWVRQILQIAHDFPTVNFVRVRGATTAQVSQFDAVPNLQNLDLSEFLVQFQQTN